MQDLSTESSYNSREKPKNETKEGIYHVHGVEDCLLLGFDSSQIDAYIQGSSS